MANGQVRVRFVELNWSLEVIITFIAAFPPAIASVIMARQLFRKFQVYLLLNLIGWAAMTVWWVLEAFAFLLLEPFLFIIRGYAFIISGFALLLLVDIVTQEFVDPIKQMIMTAAAVAMLFLMADPGVVTVDAYPNGMPTLSAGQSVGIIAFIGMALIGGTWIYFGVKIFQGAPKFLRADALLFLLGAITMIVIPGIFYATRLSRVIPGISSIFWSAGSLLTAVIFARQPKMAYVLPFKAFRVTVFDTKSGIPLFTHSWSPMEQIVNEILFAGMLQGIGSILREALRKGDIREIHLAQATLLLRQSENYPIACVLVTTKVTRTLRVALNDFAERFFAQFEPAFADTSEVSKFAGAKPLVDQCFPFIPEYLES